MKTSVMEVRDMLSVLSVSGVEQRIGEVPGVESVTVNYAAASATVRYDETRLDTAGIRSAVRQSGYAADAPADATASDAHQGHKPAAAPTATPVPGAADSTSAGTAPPDKVAPDVAPDGVAPTPPKASPDGAATAPAVSSPASKSTAHAAHGGDQSAS